MATLADVTAVVNQLASDVDASQVNITMAVQGLNAQILALQSQLASGAAVTPAELDVLVSAVQAIDAKVKTLVA